MVYKLSPELFESRKVQTYIYLVLDNVGKEAMIIAKFKEVLTCRAGHDGSSWWSSTSRSPLWRIGYIKEDVTNLHV